MKMLKRRLAIVVILIMVLSSVSSEITFAAEENRVISLEKKQQKTLKSPNTMEKKQKNH